MIKEEEKVLRLNCKTMEVEELQLSSINFEPTKKVFVNNLFELSKIDVFLDDLYADKEPCVLLISRNGDIKQVFEGHMVFVGKDKVGLNETQMQRIKALLTPKQRYINYKTDKFVKIILDM